WAAPSPSRRQRRPRSSPHRLPSASARRRWLLLPVTAPHRGSRSGSSAGSGGARGHMDERDRSPRELAERLGLLAVGAVALTAERIDELAGELAERGGMQRDEVRQLIEEAVARWRGDATRLTGRAGQGLQGIFAQLGLVTRDELEELELRLAQVEHRLRLVEGAAEPGTPSVQD
ncbi:MAG: phasin family protein, partial [Gaiellaceae bacterium]